MNGNGKVYVQLRDLEKALNADVVKKSRARGSSPTWLKSFAGQLEDPEYVELTLAERGFLHDLRLLALRRGNKILVDEKYLRGQLRVTNRTLCVPKVSRLRTLGFIEPYDENSNPAANQLIPSRTRLETSESESRLEVEVELEVPPLPPLDDGEGGSTPLAAAVARYSRQPREPRKHPATAYQVVEAMIRNMGAEGYLRDALDSELDEKRITDPLERQALHALADQIRAKAAAA